MNIENNKIEINNNNGKLQDNVASLFKFIKELNQLKYRKITDIADYPWYKFLSDLPLNEDYTVLNYRDREEVENYDDDRIIFSISRANVRNCPAPPKSIEKWLEDGWNDFKTDVKHKDFVGDFKEKDGQLSLMQEKFDDDKGRVINYNNWLALRNEWVEDKKKVIDINRLFEKLYDLFFDLRRESETMEIVVASGMIRSKKDPQIHHPILTRRIRIEFDSDNNVISLVDVDAQPELYSELFQEITNANIGTINDSIEKLQQMDYHPLDRIDTPEYFKSIAHHLSSKGVYSDEFEDSWESNAEIYVTYEPCFIVRKKRDGTIKALDLIIENIEEFGDIPNPIRDIVEGGTLELPEDNLNESIEERLAAVGGESIDILLAKQANREQLEIAKKIEQYNAVLVQGPPGTGKTHTIANLMGHFLAEGKSVLVTSHTTKALKVLKDKVIPGMQDLCVSVLEDSNIDMERSIDGITMYMSRTNSNELKAEMSSLSQDREEIIGKLAEVRRKMFNLIKQECNSVVINGEEHTPTELAKFVIENEDELSYIPGPVKLNTCLPLSLEDLTDLYRSNDSISAEDENELNSGLPDPESSLMSPMEFKECRENIFSSIGNINQIKESNNWDLDNQSSNRQIIIKTPSSTFGINYPSEILVAKLSELIKSFSNIDDWMVSAAVDGNSDEAIRQKWLMLIDAIENTFNMAVQVSNAKFGRVLEYKNENNNEHEDAFKALLKMFEEKGKVSKMSLTFHKDYVNALESVLIDGKPISSADDCNLVIRDIQLAQMRKKCAAYWDELMCLNSVPKFFDLDRNNPEQIARNYIPLIKKYLDWYQNDYVTLLQQLKSMGIEENMIFKRDALDSDFQHAKKTLTTACTIIPNLCDLCSSMIVWLNANEKLTDLKRVLTMGARASSPHCKKLYDAVNEINYDQYAVAYGEFKTLFDKYQLRTKRDQLLQTIEPYAPNWADAIRRRSGIHGECTMPANIESAWKWRQYEGIIADIASEPYEDLQRNSKELSKQYREVTALYAEKCGWYHLLQRTEADIDMKQALIGWKQTVKRIGKGTGKNAPKYRAEARRLMSKCQKAVPAWIMPISKALETLNPKENKFDVVIIDEASQSDISSLAILYMGKKLVIVGDDKQVSPLSVGTDITKVNGLEEIYIKGKIPNAHLYNGKTSIYDIAATTFHPLMLREHFRCVPDIIGFSNMLSYDGQIKPLRDDSNSELLPAVVDYRVDGGLRSDTNKTNNAEANAIVDIMQACIKEEEYKDKTFGVISLVGEDQAKLIQSIISQKIPRKEIEKREILCGNSASFQGDERDVIFLSMVDSNNGEGPLRLKSFGTDDADRKRYNVAVSRAKDQIWIVNSLDAANDLKGDDIRKKLLDYAKDPHAIEVKKSQAEARAESPFEAAIAKSLINRGYNLVQQWKVGSYRLDIVATSGNNAVAIECDGERWHSGDEKIREDMERQTILERLGWKFIRIRGSEYYRNPEATIERVIKELAENNIIPGGNVISIQKDDTELLRRIKNNIAELNENKKPDIDRIGTIASALNE